MRLCLASAPHVITPDGAVQSLSSRDGALLAWLALEGPTPRLRLARLLWPDSDDETARNALRQRLFQLRRQFGDGLLVGQATLALAEGVQHDLTDSDGVLADGAHDFGAELSDWLQQQRVRRRQRERQSLAELADMAEQARDYADALTHARELLALEPLSEAAHRRMMRLHYLAGDRAAALLAFDHCEQTLKDEVGAPPAPETLALLAHIEASVPAGNGPQPQVLPASLVRPPRHIGREPECAELLAAWASSEPFLLLGESGMGKSRLLDSLAHSRPGVLVVGARPGDEHVPLALVTKLTEALCQRLPALLQHEPLRELRQLLAIEVLHGASAARPAPRSLSPALRVLLERASTEWPVLALVFDDWQFADDASVDLIQEAMGGPLPPALRWGYASRMLAGARADARIAALQRRSGLRTLTLAPLALPAVCELVATLQLGETDARSLASALLGQVGGNPLHILETLRHLLEAQRPLRPQEVKAPGQVKQLVAARLAQLPEAPRQLLRLAAVAGDDFGVELAETVLGRDALALWDDWSLLEHMGLFSTVGIAHDLYAESVLDTLPAPIGRVLHGRVAAWLEARPHEPARMAAHWLAAGDEARALPHLTAAAHKAWFAARATEAFDFFRRAGEVALAHVAVDAAFDLAFDNAEAMSEIGTPALLQACLELMTPLAHTEPQHLRVRFIDAVLNFVRGHTEQGLRAVIGLLSEAIALRDTRVEAECRYAIANRAVADGEFDLALQHLAAAERLVQQSGELRRASALGGIIAMLLGLRGQTRLAIREHERVLPLLEAQGDRATWTVVTAAKAAQHARQGDVAQAVSGALRAIESVASVSIAPPDTIVALRYTVESLRSSARFDEALRACDAFERRLAIQGTYPRACEPVAALYLHLGRADLAAPLLQGLKAEPPQRLRERQRLDLLLVQAAMQQGQPVEQDWPRSAVSGDDLVLSIEWALWSGLQAQPPWSGQTLHALWLRARDAEVPPWERPLRFLVAQRLLDDGQADLGRELVPESSALDLLQGLYASTPWAALYGSRVLARVGEVKAAAALARAGADWLQHTARTAMPEPFRDSFLGRNPVNRELLAWLPRLASS